MSAKGRGAGLRGRRRVGASGSVVRVAVMPPPPLGVGAAPVSAAKTSSRPGSRSDNSVTAMPAVGQPADGVGERAVPVDRHLQHAAAGATPARGRQTAASTAAVSAQPRLVGRADLQALAAARSA